MERMKRERLNEEAIKRLPIPDEGNRITYFAGAVLQGLTAPRGFGVRVTAGGSQVLRNQLPDKGSRTSIHHRPIP